MRRIFFGIITSLLLICVPMRGLAEEYSVTAKVPAPLPATIPVVIGPTTTEQQSSGVYITGTCTIVVPTLIVILVRDAQTIGSGSCSANGTFSIFIGLVLGTNTIYPQFLTITGDKGGFGEPITLVYKQVVDESVNAPVQSQPTITYENTPGLNLLFDYDIVTYTDQKKTELEYSLSGGTAPYTVVVSWGDETQNKYTNTAAGKHNISHTYKKILPPSKLTISVTDARGNKAYQSRALVSFRQGVYVPPAQPEQQTSKNWFSVWLIGAACFAVVLFLARLPHMQVDIAKKTKSRKKK